MKRLGFLAVLALAGCSRVTTEKPLPWFKIEATHRPSLGGLADAVTTYESHVKYRGFWRKLERCDGGEVLDTETVALFCSDGFERGIALVRKGEPVPRPACGTLASMGIILPGKDAVDCFDVLEGRAPVAPTRLRFRRVDLSGRTLMRAALYVEHPGREFLGLGAHFYDDGNAPYFVTRAQGPAAPDCALLALERGSLRTVASGPELSITQCYESRAWSDLSGLRLIDSLQRAAAPVSDVPFAPQKLHVIIR